MFKNYLTRSTHFGFILGLFLSWWISSYGLFVVLLLLYALVWWLFRNPALEKTALLKSSDQEIYSPVQGKLAEVITVDDYSFFGKEMIALRITQRPWETYQVRLPVSSEVIDFHYKPVKGPLRWLRPDSGMLKKALGVSLTLKSKEGEYFGLQFLKCFLGRWPKLSLVPGDRGRVTSQVGHIPLGGTVILYLPKKYQLQVQVGELLDPGETLIASCKESDQSRERGES